MERAQLNQPISDFVSLDLVEISCRYSYACLVVLPAIIINVLLDDDASAHPLSDWRLKLAVYGTYALCSYWAQGQFLRLRRQNV
eukprot:scaffold491740_cov32-Prasinocladus_malaysianus.AAC.1